MTLRQLIRKLFVNTPFAKETSLKDKHVIVTGTDNGSLGYETAKTLARWGAVVIVSSPRNTASLVTALTEDLAKENIDARIDGHDLDLSDAKSVSQFAQWYLDNWGERLDILVNNAGVHLDLMSKWKEPRLTDDGYELMWRINYLGSAHLTRLLLPLLQKTGESQGDARVVNVASQIHSKGSNDALFDPNTEYESWKFYGLSKLAMIHFAYEINRRFAQKSNLKGYCLHPGAASGSSTNVATVGFEENPIIGFFRKLGGPIERLFMTTPEEGAQTTIHCATSPQAEGGHYYTNCGIGEASADTNDEKAAGRLWQETSDWIDTLTNPDPQ